MGVASCVLCRVALRKESVDRNLQYITEPVTIQAVALRKESVDRNVSLLDTSRSGDGRSPQGERG